LPDPLANVAGVEALNEYLTNLASASPAPGGGSAAMVVGATGCALVSMVARICVSSPKYASKHDLANRLTTQADALRTAFLERKERDERAFDAVVAARGDRAAMEAALAGAAAVPLEGAQAALAALRLAADALALGNANLVSDLGCAAEFAYAALLACAYNVRINHKFMKDEGTISSQASELERLEREALPLLTTVRSALPR
jgi:methenyltetrahydrofolate cyclohydrolase